jgi:hypothetical protein
MAYIRVNSSVEYDPVSNTVRQGGQVRPGGFAALGFSNLPEVQEAMRALAPAEAGSGQKPAPAGAPAAAVTASGAPQIILSPTPVPNPWDYQGPAASNPYYTQPGVPMRDGFVAGYENWFETCTVLPGADLTGGEHTIRVASHEGAQEALRLVQQYVPGASVRASDPGAFAGPWYGDKPALYIALPNGGRLDAAAILDSYYDRGRGVSALSDLVLHAELRWQTGLGGLERR